MHTFSIKYKDKGEIKFIYNVSYGRMWHCLNEINQGPWSVKIRHDQSGEIFKLPYRFNKGSGRNKHQYAHYSDWYKELKYWGRHKADMGPDTKTKQVF